MTDHPEIIWLINEGEQSIWCDCPDPSDGIEPEDVTKYIRADKVVILQKQVEKLKMKLNNLTGD